MAGEKNSLGMYGPYSEETDLLEQAPQEDPSESETQKRTQFKMPDFSKYAKIIMHDAFCALLC